MNTSSVRRQRKKQLGISDEDGAAQAEVTGAGAAAPASSGDEARATTSTEVSAALDDTGGDVASGAPAGISTPLAAAAEVGAPGAVPSIKPADEHQEDVHGGPQPPLRIGADSKAKAAGRTKRARALGAPQALREGAPTVVVAGAICRQKLEAGRRRKRKMMGKSAGPSVVAPAGRIPLCLDGIETVRFLRRCLPSALTEAWQQQQKQEEEQDAGPQEGQLKQGDEQTEGPPADAHVSLAAWGLAHRVFQGQNVHRGGTSTTSVCSIDGNTGSSSSHPQAPGACSDNCFLALAVPLPVAARVVCAAAFTLDQRQKQQPQPTETLPEETAAGGTSAVPSSATRGNLPNDDNPDSGETSSKPTPPEITSTTAAETPTAAAPGTATGGFFPRVWVVCEDDHQAASFAALLRHFLHSDSGRNGNSSGNPQQQVSTGPVKAFGSVCCVLQATRTVRQRQQFVSNMKRTKAAVFGAPAFAALVTTTHFEDESQQLQRQEQQQQQGEHQQQQGEHQQQRGEQQPRQERQEDLDKVASSPPVSPKQQPAIEGKKSPQQHQHLLLQQQLMLRACEMLVVQEAPTLWKDQSVLGALRLFNDSSGCSRQRRVLYCSSFLPPSQGELQQWLSEAKAREALIPAAVQQTVQPVSLPLTGAGDGPPREFYGQRARGFLLLLLQRQVARCIRRVGLEDSRLLQLLQQQQEQQQERLTFNYTPGSLATAPSTTTAATAAEAPATAAATGGAAADEPAAAAPPAASPGSPARARVNFLIVSISSNSESSSDEDPHCPGDKTLAKPPQAPTPKAVSPTVCCNNSEAGKGGVAAVSASLQRYRRFIEAFSTALLEATAGLRQQGLLFPNTKQLKLRQWQRSQQVVRCLGVPEAAITKDDIQAARAAIHLAEKQQQQRTAGGNKTPLRCSLLQRRNVQREALVLECRFSMMLLEGRALLGSGGPIVATEYLDAQAAACTNNSSSSSGTSVEGMQRHLHSRATRQLLSAARAAAATAAAKMQRAARRQDLCFGLVMELVLSLLHVFHQGCKDGASTSGDADSGESATSNSSSAAEANSSKSIPLHSVVERGALLLTSSPEDAAAAAAALMNAEGAGFAVQLLEPAALDAAAAAAGSAPCRRRRAAAAVDEARTSSSTSGSSNSTSPCWSVSHGKGGLPKVLLETKPKKVVVADVATAARGISSSCRWRLVVLLFASSEIHVWQSWCAHRFSAACVDGLYFMREEQQHQPPCLCALGEAKTETQNKAASPQTASPSVFCVRRVHSVSPGGHSSPDVSAECNCDRLSNSVAALPTLEELRAAAALGGRRSLVVAVPISAAAAGSMKAQTAAADELFVMLHGLKGNDHDGETVSITSTASVNSCTSSEFVASCSSAVVQAAMNSEAAGLPATAGEHVETTGCLLLPNRQLLPMGCLFADAFYDAACAVFQLQHLQQVKAQGKKRRGTSPRPSAAPSGSESCVSTSAALVTAAKTDQVKTTVDIAATIVPSGDAADGCSGCKATEIPGSPVHLGAADTLASATTIPTDAKRERLCSDVTSIAVTESGCKAAHSPSFSSEHAAKTSSPEVKESHASHKCTLATLSPPTADAAATAVSAHAVAGSGSALPPIVVKRQERTPAEVSRWGEHSQDSAAPLESMIEQAGPSCGALCNTDDAVRSKSAPSAKKAVTEGASADSQDSALGVRCTQEARRTCPVAVTPTVGLPKTGSAWPSPSSLCEELHAALADDDIFSLQLPAGNDRDFGCVPPTAVVATDANTSEQSTGSLEPRYSGRGLQDGERRSDNGISGDTSGSECPLPTVILAAECFSAISGKNKPVARLRLLRTTEQCGVPTVAQLWWLLPETEHPLSRFFC